MQSYKKVCNVFILLLPVYYFCKMLHLRCFDRVLNMPLTCYIISNCFSDINFFQLTQPKWKTGASQKQPPNVFFRKKCSKKFQKIHRKFTGLRHVTLLKKRPWHKCCPVNFARFLRTHFLQNTSRRLPLASVYKYPWNMISYGARAITPGENCPLDDSPKDNCPPDNWSKTITQKVIAPKENYLSDYLSHIYNCPSDKWPRRKLPHRKIVPTINYIRYIFPQESEVVVL